MVSLGNLTAISLVRYLTVVRPFNVGDLTNRGVAIAIGTFIAIHILLYHICDALIDLIYFFQICTRIYYSS